MAMKELEIFGGKHICHCFLSHFNAQRQQSIGLRFIWGKKTWLAGRTNPQPHSDRAGSVAPLAVELLTSV